jgi:integrase
LGDKSGDKIEQPYVIKRGDVLFYRRRVPVGAEERFGGKTEFVRTLKGGTVRQVQLELARVTAEFERRAWPPKPHPEELKWPLALDHELAERLARAALSAQKAVNLELLGLASDNELDGLAEAKLDHARHTRRLLLQGKVPEPWRMVARALLARENIDPAQHPAFVDVVARAYGEARAELATQLSLRARGEPERVANEAMFGSKAYSQDARAAQSITLEQAKQRFLSNPLNQISATTLQQYRPRLKVIVEALGPSRPVASVTKSDCRRLVEDVFLKLPSNHTKKYPGLTLSEAVKKGAEEGAPVIALKTQRLYVELLKTFFEWAEQDDIVEASPARKAPLPKGRTGERSGFSIAELNTIFHAPLYTGCRDDENGYAFQGDAKPRRHRFWIPLIALYSGMRVQEIALLRRRDLRHEWDVDFFDLVEDRVTGRTLKTKGSVRCVPVHPVLIDLGLLTYAQRLPADGYLFPDLLKGAKDPGDSMSKWFGRFLASLEIIDPSLVFHSFRHTFATGCRASGISREQQEAIGGWVYKGTSGGYGDESLPELARALARLEYKGLDLRHLRPALDVHSGDPTNP